MLFGNQTLSVVQASVRRAKDLVEEDRRLYATELMDFYAGFGHKYIAVAIVASFKKQYIQDMMKQLIVPFPILQDFTDQFSAVYDVPPKRIFTLDGKCIVAELPETEGDSYIDEEKYYVDKQLKDTLDSIYDLEMCTRIKNSEAMTNLLNTTIYKVNNREGKLHLDFIPNDIVTVGANVEDPTVIDSLCFLKQSFRDVNNVIKLTYEYWNLEEFYITDEHGELQSVKGPNRAVSEWLQLNDNKAMHIGPGFAPFIVLRSELSDDDFWNIKNKDIVDCIKQILLSFTELRYLQRYGSFGLKWVLGAKVPDDASLDLLGIMELSQDSKSNIPGIGSENVSVGEFQNVSRMQELAASIMDGLRFLYALKGLNTDRLLAMKQAESGEAKKIDQQQLIGNIIAQQDIWKLNEQNIFNTLISVWNRDNVNAYKIPKDVNIGIDYYDAFAQAGDVLKEIEAFMSKIQNNIKTPIDWIMQENPNLTEKEAANLYQRNKDINKSMKIPNDKLTPDANMLLTPESLGITQAQFDQVTAEADKAGMTLEEYLNEKE